MSHSFARQSSSPLIRHLAVSALCVWAGGGDPAVAQTAPNPPAPQVAQPAFIRSSLADELKWLEAERLTVSTASLRAETVEHAAATVRVLTQRQLQERGHRTLEDVLKSLPGVDVLNHVHADSKNIVSLRGVTGNNRFLILQDGIRISAPTGETSLQVSENYPLYMAKQVEILSGPASALYGADAMTGVINIITQDAPRAGTVEGRFGMGSFQSWQGSFHAAKRFSDAVAVSLGGHYQRSDGAPLGRHYPADFATLPAGSAPYQPEYHSFSSWAKVDLWENLTFGWNQSFLATSVADAEQPGLATTYDGPPVNPTSLGMAYVKYQFTADERLSGMVAVNYSRYERLPHSSYRNVFSTVAFAPPFTPAYKYAYGERVQVEPRVQVELERHILSAGLTADYSYSIPKTVDLATPYDTSRALSQQGQTYLGSTIPARLFEETAYNAGMFLQAQTEWTPELSSTVGVRLDYNSIYGETVNPRLGLVWQPRSETTLKMLYGRSFLAPSAQQRLENYGTVSTNTPYFFIPNPDLQPEQLQTLEVSVSQQLTDDLTVGAVAFYTLMDHTILSVYNSGVSNATFIPGITITDTEQRQNVGETRVRGLELTLEHTWKSELTRVNLWGSFTYLNGTVKNRARNVRYDLPFTSTELLKLGATLNHAERFVLTPSLQWNGPQTGGATPGAVQFGTRTPDFFVVNLYGEVRTANQNAALFIRADNLLDRRYYNAGFGNFPGSPGFFYATPQDSRSVSVGLRLSY